MDALAVFLPLVSFLIAGLFGKTLGAITTNFITCALLLTAAAFSILTFHDVALIGNTSVKELGTWIAIGNFSVDWALRFDALSTLMMVVITSVSAMVHIYSIGYMSHDKSRQRFMAYLGLFTFTMLMLVTANNLLQLFMGWEGVGLASYLLIGFWFHKESANKASIKAFVTNRVGDVGLILGICGLYLLTGSLEFDAIFKSLDDITSQQVEFFGINAPALEIIAILLFIGAVGKSAQLGLHVWLPDAMEGPTPVSALIHAATMVTAGVFLLCRVSPLLEYAPFARDVIIFLGASTAIFAATIGLTQYDIKRVIAYSTCSQLGYMVMAAGLGAYGGAMFHLFTHAFFKALLFLGAGSVIHAMSDEQDMRNMGGLAKLIPTTFALMLLGSLALAGIPPFAGYYSKDMIIESAWAGMAHPHAGASAWVAQYAFIIGVLVALMTAFYSWRLLIMTFHGKPRCNDVVAAHVHESGRVMLIPMFILAIGAVLAGKVGYEYFVGHEAKSFWKGVLAYNDVVHHAHDAPVWVKKLPLVAAISGIGLAYLLYLVMPNLQQRIKSSFSALHNLFFHKWYVDELYSAVFIKNAFCLGRLSWKLFDSKLIDGLPNGAASLTRRLSGRTSTMQTGYVYHYAFAMITGLVLLIGYFLLIGTGSLEGLWN